MTYIVDTVPRGGEVGGVVAAVLQPEHAADIGELCSLVVVVRDESCARCSSQ